MIDEQLWLQCRAMIPQVAPRRLPSHLGKVGPCQAFLVDGYLVKIRHSMDFVEGDNAHHSSWIPKGQVWVDANISPRCQPFILYHEVREWAYMDEGESYEKAHPRVCEEEKQLMVRLLRAKMGLRRIMPRR